MSIGTCILFVVCIGTCLIIIQLVANGKIHSGLLDKDKTNRGSKKKPQK